MGGGSQVKVCLCDWTEHLDQAPEDRGGRPLMEVVVCLLRPFVVLLDETTGSGRVQDPPRLSAGV